MITFIEQDFLENEQTLKNEGFSFDLIGQQLDYLANCSSEFYNPPSLEIREQARIIYRHLVSKGWVDSRIEHTIIYSQARNLINSFVDYAY